MSESSRLDTHERNCSGLLKSYKLIIELIYFSFHWNNFNNSHSFIDYRKQGETFSLKLDWTATSLLRERSNIMWSSVGEMGSQKGSQKITGVRGGGCHQKITEDYDKKPAFVIQAFPRREKLTELLTLAPSSH